MIGYIFFFFVPLPVFDILTDATGLFTMNRKKDGSKPVIGPRDGVFLAHLSFALCRVRHLQEQGGS